MSNNSTQKKKTGSVGIWPSAGLLLGMGRKDWDLSWAEGKK